MNKFTRLCLLVLVLLGLLPAGANAQVFAAAGTRAQGMGGAFVGVADDGTAIYWNPAGLAAGSYFSLVLDAGGADASPDQGQMGGPNSSFLIGLSTPALGLGYYRLKASRVAPPLTLLPIDEAPSSRNLSVPAQSRVDTLITHQAGVTLVQSIVQGVAIGTTLKMVRGLAASRMVDAATVDEALGSDAAEVMGQASTRFDVDLGVMATGGPLKVGLTVRNIREPKFDSPDGGSPLVLERQARAGLSYAVSTNWVAAADFDLLRSHDAFGERRDVAFGVEGRLGRRAYIRSGVSANMLHDPAIEDARGLAYSVGGSFAVKGAVLVDGHLTAGEERTGLGWGLAARFIY